MTTNSIKATESNDVLTPYSKTVLDTLESLLGPGGRLRLSPYAESAQILKLFGELPLPKSRNRDIRRLIQSNKKKIDGIVKYWVEFVTAGKTFDNHQYTINDFLDAYLAYYFPMSVAKIQQVLIDVIRSSQLPAEINLLDIGIGTGSTAIGVLDFLLAWQIVCDLSGALFPVQAVSITCIDKNQSAIEYTQDVLQAYKQVLLQRAKQYKDDLPASYKIAIHAIENADFKQIDIEHSPITPDPKFNLIVASNLLDELNSDGKASLTSVVRNASENALVLILEPGDEKRSIRLMQWRNQTISRGGFELFSPCSEITGAEDCSLCWNSRRKSFHQSPLYRNFRVAATSFLPDKRSFDDFENNLLSWSNVWLKRASREYHHINHLSNLQAGVWPADIPLHFIGAFGNYKGAFDTANIPIDQKPDQAVQVQPTEWLKFCSATANKEKLYVARQHGYLVPPFKYGETIKIQNATYRQANNNAAVIDLNENSVFERLNPTHSKKATFFLTEYNDKVRMAVDEIGFRLFGFEKMHPFQHQIISWALMGKSILGIAATGSGKSECFILPSMALPGITVVVSPLISLMMDQYDQRICDRYGLDSLATFFNGEVPFIERQARLRRMEMGYYKLVYFTPEQLERSYILDSLRRADKNVGIRYLAMDEAHCISQWGHDFRQAYLNIVRRLGDYEVHPVRLALTATASPYVRNDICDELGLSPSLLEEGGDVFIESSNRPELNLIVRVKRTTNEKVDEMISDLRQLIDQNKNNVEPGAAIVFMPETGGNPDAMKNIPPQSRRGRFSAGVSPIASYLERVFRKKVSIYHSKMDMDLGDPKNGTSPTIFGDLSGRSRRSEQENFISGKTEIMVATKGFGMGIDKENIRLILHRTPPGNMEAYAQESGRAGRDGLPANVVLYYSPDSPEEEDDFGKTKKIHSDHNIQTFFLEEKYVRREDLLVMKAFLRELTPNAANYYYFTSDQAITFFDHCVTQSESAEFPISYRWPKFPQRRISGCETEDHKIILDNGDLYKNKAGYIDRILQVLYKIRPSIPGKGVRLAFFEQVHETGIKCVTPLIKNIDGILHSNTYFGELFRKAGFDPKILASFLRNEDLSEIAKGLSLPLHEIAGMYQDIKLAEGSVGVNGKWVPKLFDFKAIVVPSIAERNLPLSREYYGAQWRASKYKAEQRAKENRRPQPNLDDWFWWDEINKPRGWEIQLGAAFDEDLSFDIYESYFMKTHDERKENDIRAYHRLLSDYVGVSTDGQLIYGNKKGECLRSVLLGYLETYEVIEGNNCYGCSRCVPDENFGRYTIDQRRAVVTRMANSTKEVFDELKVLQDKIPSIEQEKLFMSAMEREEQVGRSLNRYFTGWSGRLLDLIPSHQTAKWLRMVAMANHMMPMQTNEFVEYFKDLYEKTAFNDKSRYKPLVESIEFDFKNDIAIQGILADFYRSTDDLRKEIESLESIINREGIIYNQDRKVFYYAAMRLSEIFKEKDQLKYETRRYILGAWAGRTAENYQDSRTWYETVVGKWDLKEVLAESKNQKSFKSPVDCEAALWASWISATPSSIIGLLGKEFNDLPIELDEWPTNVKSTFIAKLPASIISLSPKLSQTVLENSEDTELVLTIGFSAIANGSPLKQPVLKKLLLYSTENPKICSKILSSQAQNEEDQLKIIEHLLQSVNFSTLDLVQKGISLYDSYLKDCENLAFKLITKGIPFLINSSYNAENLEKLEILIPSILENPEQIGQVTKLWWPICLNDGKALLHFISLLIQRGVYQPLVDELTADFINNGNFKALEGLCLIESAPRLTRAIQMMSAVFRYCKHNPSGSLVITTKAENLNSLCDEFAWRTDPEQADMLTICLLEIQKKLNPNWRTPIGRLAEVLCYGGRFTHARKVDLANPGLTFGPGRLPFEEFVKRLRISERTQSINQDYLLIYRRVFE